MVDCLCTYGRLFIHGENWKERRQYLVLREWVTINSFYIIAIWYYMVNKKIGNIRAVYISKRNIVGKFRETGHQDGSVGKVHTAKNDDLSLILRINMMEQEKWLPRVVFWSPHLCHGIDVLTQIRHTHTHTPHHKKIGSRERIKCWTRMRPWVWTRVISTELRWKNTNLEKSQNYEVMILLGLHVDLKSHKAHLYDYLSKENNKEYLGNHDVYLNSL